MADEATEAWETGRTMLPGTAKGNDKMRVVLLRVGIDTGCGGIHGPLFADGSVDFLPIPDRFRGNGIDKRTYSNTSGKYGRKLVDYFPQARQKRISSQSIHVDPEFDTFTYGDPTPPKASLRRLDKGSLLVFIKEHQLGLGAMATMPAIITTAYAGLSRLQPVRQRDLTARELPAATADSADIFCLRHRSLRSKLTVDMRERNVQP
jgi:hypothetical protein